MIMRFSNLALGLILSAASTKAQNGIATAPDCSGQNNRFGAPKNVDVEKNLCIAEWAGEKGNEKFYPADFFGITNEVKIYRCEELGKRIIVSNSIPDHHLTVQNNNNYPCEIPWYVEMPLDPEYTPLTQKYELPNRGIVAMAKNGVPAFGPQESDSLNAVEPTDSNKVGAKYWYGHAGGDSGWHVHNPQMGKEMVTSESFLGWAMDGFEIWGPLSDDELDALTLAGKMDDCNGVLSDDGSYRYHVRTNDQVDGDGEYCNGDSPVINWNYILGCYSGDITETNVYNADDQDVPEGCVEEDGTTDAPVEEPTKAPTDVGGPTTLKKRPNIIIMQPDDLVFMDEWTPPPNNPTTPSSENKIPEAGMPNIELLRNSGLQMKQAYAASAVCGTSRYSTITGKMPSRASSVRDKNQAQPSKVTVPTTKLEGDDCSTENLAQAFRDEDYATAMIGKWHLSKINKNEYTYESSVNTVKGCGFDFVGGLYIENLAATESESNLYSDGTFSHNMEWITYEAVNFIEEQAKSDTPFFMYFNPTVPHGSNDVKKALEDFSCQDTADQDFNWPGNEDPYIPGMVEDGCEKYRESVIERANGIKGDLGKIWLDDSVGALLRALEDNGIYEDTIFLFQEDHMMDAKGTLFENGIRIPQFIHYPAGIEAGTNFDAPVSTVDIAATMLDYAGIEAPYEMDGKSWKNVIGNAERESYWKNDRCLFFEVDQDRAVRCGCFKWLDIDNESSTSYTRGGDKGHLVELGGMLFDLCDGGEDYILDNNNNREANKVINESQENTLKNNLQCHLDNTEPNGNPVFDVCGEEPPETLEPETGSPTTSPTTSPTKSPTAAPKATCKDSGLNAFIDNAFISCAKIEEQNLCTDKKVWGHCRKSCKKCKKCRDSKAKFKVTIPGTNKKKKKNCKFVKNNIELCNEEDIFHACGKTCGACS